MHKIYCAIPPHCERIQPTLGNEHVWSKEHKLMYKCVTETRHFRKTEFFFLIQINNIINEIIAEISVSKIINLINLNIYYTCRQINFTGTKTLNDLHACYLFIHASSLSHTHNPPMQCVANLKLLPFCLDGNRAKKERNAADRRLAGGLTLQVLWRKGGGGEEGG